METIEPTAFTDEAVKKLGGLLLHSTRNVYNVVSAHFGVKSDAYDHDALWARLRTVGGVFKCEECNTWLEVAEAVDYRDDFCRGCDDEQSASEED